MKFNCGNTSRLIFMLVLVALYFLVELIVGYLIHSLSLVADAFHMLSDFWALVIGLLATRIAKWPSSSKNTFGWQRAEVMGGLINTVMLITLCGTILLQAIQRFIMPEAIEDPRLMIYVGTGGLVVNILGLIVFGVHSHDSHGRTIEVVDNDTMESVTIDAPLRQDGESDFYHQNPAANGALILDPDVNCLRTNENQLCPNDISRTKHLITILPGDIPKQVKRSKSLNMRAVFLHVLADFFGSIIVIVSALLLDFTPGDTKAEGSWKLYVDPAMSVLMVVIVLVSAAPVMHKTALILLQSVPGEISIKNLKERLETIDGIHKVHDLHVWRLQSNCIIGTVHIRCASLPDYLKIARQAKDLFHDFNIHCTTIQPEFEEYSELESARDIDYQTCVLDCGPNKTCQSDTCCPAPTNATSVVTGATSKLLSSESTANTSGDSEMRSTNNGPANAQSASGSTRIAIPPSEYFSRM